MKKNEENSMICCPTINPDDWRVKNLEWVEKQFIRDKVFTFFFMPVNFGKVMRKLDTKVKQASAGIPDNLCLSDHTSKWNMNVLLAVDKEIPGAENLKISGKFFSNVYEGSYKDTGKWCKDFEQICKNKGYEIKKWYMWYTTCPKCAKKYGKNYVVIIADLK
jgi:hypothetical protein